jgi:hypothetical protein
MKTLMIAPEGVYVDGKHSTPDHIIITLPDGQSMDIDTAIKYLQKKYKTPKEPGKFSQIKQILLASHPKSESDQVSPTVSTQSQTTQ